jgi:hypothetical protein
MMAESPTAAAWKFYFFNISTMAIVTTIITSKITTTITMITINITTTTTLPLPLLSSPGHLVEAQKPQHYHPWTADV